MQAFFGRKYPDMKYLAYFQAYTNTYGSLAGLKRKYEEALDVDGVVGLVIGTRPDCVDEGLLDYLADIGRQAFLIVEYGIESVYDRTLKRINRGHGFECVRRAVCATAERDIHVGAHIILGLPGESHSDMVREAEVLSQLPITTMKLHQLQLIKGTRMAEEYRQCPEDFLRFTADEYADLVVEFVRHSRPDMVFERFVSQSPTSLLAEPGWGLKNYEFVELVRRKFTSLALGC